VSAFRERLEPHVSGVGHGDHEESLPLVGRTDVGGAELDGLHDETFAVEPGDNRVQPSPLERGDVLDDDPDGSQLTDEAEVFEPEAGARTVESGSLPGVGQILAGEAAAQDVDGLEDGGINGSDIGVPPGLGPMPLEHRKGERVDLDLPDHVTHAGELEAGLETPDPAEQGSDAQTAAHEKAPERTTATASSSTRSRSMI
jgi:hypothetical protein